MRQVCNGIKKETHAQLFLCELCELFKNTAFTGQLLVTTSEQLFSTTVLNGCFTTMNNTVIKYNHFIQWATIVRSGKAFVDILKILKNLRWRNNIFSHSRPCISESCIKIKINLILFYFYTSLCCVNRFYEGLVSGL